MKNKWLTSISLLCLMALTHASTASAQMESVDIHGFISQGYLKSDANNYLAETEDGSFQFNETGINFATEVEEGLRLGMQFFARDLGELGNDEVVLDWAFADYRWRDELGVRIGKMKMTMALYGETRDADMLRTSIFLPQGVYNEGWRDTFSTLKGSGLYGTLPLSMLGTLSYSGQYGIVSPKAGDGQSRYLDGRGGFTIAGYDSVDYGYSASMIWNTFVPGLRLGTSSVGLEYVAEIPLDFPSPDTMFDFWAKTYNYTFSMEFTYKDLIIASEYVCTVSDYNMKEPKSGLTVLEAATNKMEGWYGSGAYRFCEWFEIGLYYSEFYPDKEDRDGIIMAASTTNPLPRTNAWQKDWALSLRFDLNQNWVLKLEGHLMDGTAVMYPQDQGNPQDLERYWNLLAAKVTFNF